MCPCVFSRVLCNVLLGDGGEGWFPTIMVARWQYYLDALGNCDRQGAELRDGGSRM